MCSSDLGYDAPMPGDVEWDAAEEPQGILPNLITPVRWALYNRGVDLMGNSGGMVSSSHGEREVADTIGAIGAAVADLRAEGLLG